MAVDKFNEKFLEWITIEEDKGFDRAKIREYLLSKNYMADEIDQAFKELDKRKLEITTQLKPVEQPVNSDTNAWAWLALIFGIILPPLGIIFAMVSIKKIFHEKAPGAGLTHAAVMLGTIVWWILLIILWGGEFAQWMPLLLVTVLLLEWIIFVKFIFVNKEHYFIILVCVLAFIISLAPLLIYTNLEPPDTPASTIKTSGTLRPDFKSEPLTQYELRFSARCIMIHPHLTCVLVNYTNTQATVRIMRNADGAPKWQGVSLWAGDYCTPTDVKISRSEAQEFTCPVPQLIRSQVYKKTIQLTYYDGEKQLNTVNGRLLVIGK